MIVVDAGVLIAHLDPNHDARVRAFKLLNSAGTEDFGVSPLTLAEVLAKTVRERQDVARRGDLRAIGVVEVPFGPNAGLRLARLRAETDLTMPDCCVLLAAEDGDATAILTMEERLRAQAVRLGFGCPDVQP